MCGVPHHSAEGYIGRLVKGGKRVAIAEQTTIPQPGKLVERELTRVISAGTLADMNLLDSSRHNYIVALYRDKKRFGLACVDHTTGEFSVAQFEHMDLLLDELSRINPSELLVSDEQTDCFPGTHPTLYYDGYTFLPSTAIPNLLSHFRVHSLDGFGCGEMTAALGASGAVLHYLSYQLRRPTDHLRRISVRATENAVLIDQASQRNLDLVDSRGGVKLSLLGTLDRTSTPMGARKLRDWLLHPCAIWKASGEAGGDRRSAAGALPDEQAEGEPEECAGHGAADGAHFPGRRECPRPSGAGFLPVAHPRAQG